MLPLAVNAAPAHVNGHLGPGQRKVVYTLTYCPKPELLYGSTLLFKTLRVGFPTAEVHVVDNNSIPEAVAEIARLAAANHCRFHRLTTFTSHHAFLSRLILDPDAHGTLVIIDPDVCFWQNCQDWYFDKLLAGRLIPAFVNEYSECVDLPRIHTSFWWIQDVAALRARILKDYRKSFIGYLEPFIPYTFRHQGRWVKFDTGSNLYAAIAGDIHPFGEAELSAFDHLMVGTHLDVVGPELSPEAREGSERLHDWARNDFTRLKGLWKFQEHFFRTHAPQADSGIR